MFGRPKGTPKTEVPNLIGAKPATKTRPAEKISHRMRQIPFLPAGLKSRLGSVDMAEHPSSRFARSPLAWLSGLALLIIIAAGAPILWLAFSDGPESTSTGPVPAASSHPTLEPIEFEPDIAALEKSFARMKTSGTAGAAIARCGTDEVITIGKLQSTHSWSTIKVPVAIAASRKGADPADVHKTITESDNEAAARLWVHLGTDAKRVGRIVEEELARGGDPKTSVETREYAPLRSAFGKTIWPLDRQARYALSLPDNPDAEPILHLMTQIIPEQQFGFGSLSKANTKFHFKVGWGPSDTGHVARQFAVIQTDRGETWGVAIASDSPHQLVRAQRDLNTIAEWVMKHLDEFGPAEC